MPKDLPDFDKAEFTGQPVVRLPHTPGEDVASSAWDTQRSDHARFIQAVLYGVVAALLSSMVYAAFTIITHIEIGYLAVGVGYVIGKAMLHATQGLGGRKYQITAAVLTYFAVSLASVPEILWSMHTRGTDISHLSAHSIAFLARYGVASPFLELQDGFVSGLIGLFILFIGIRAAWQFTADRRIAA